MNDERAPEPTAVASYGFAWQRYKRHFLHVVLIGLVLAVASMPAGIADSGPDEQPVSPLLQLLVGAYTLFVLQVIRYGADWLFLRVIRGEETAVAEVFAGFRRDWLNIVLTSLLVFAIVGVGFILLIVPGIVFACRLAFVPYLVMDRRLEPVAAVQASWNMTRGYALSIFGLFLLAIPIGFAGLLAFGVGLFFALLWVGLAIASMYHAVELAEGAPAAAAGGTGNTV